MSLSASKLARGLQELAGSGKSPPKTFEEAGRRWARAYAEYAKDARANGSIPPAPLDLNEQVLAATLTGVFASSRTRDQTAAQISAALTVFWLTPPVVFGAGAVSSVTGTNLLNNALKGAWAANFGGRLGPEPAAKNVAVVVDAFTHTVLVTLPGPITVPIA